MNNYTTHGGRSPYFYDHAAASAPSFLPFFFPADSPFFFFLDLVTFMGSGVLGRSSLTSYGGNDGGIAAGVPDLRGVEAADALLWLVGVIARFTAVAGISPPRSTVKETCVACKGNGLNRLGRAGDPFREVAGPRIESDD